LFVDVSDDTFFHARNKSAPKDSFIFFSYLINYTLA